jgi:transposase
MKKGMSQSVNYRKRRRNFTETEKHKIINELISTKCTKAEIWRKYTGEEVEHGQILYWMRKLGYRVDNSGEISDIAAKNVKVQNDKSKPIRLGHVDEESFESLQSKKRIAELERQLKDAELRAIAFSTMVDIAEREYKIPIRKKYNTKP